MEMVDMITCKFVGHASLNNDSFIYCDLLTFANRVKGGNSGTQVIPAPLVI